MLLPLVPLYLMIFYLKRLFSRPVKFAIPVICVGNITTGGTGKTSAVIGIAAMLKDRGFKPGVVSRGYRGTVSKQGGIVSDGCNVLLSAQEAGDEAVLIALSLKDIPVAVCADRPAAVRDLLQSFDVDVILMDDGFQNNSIVKDINIVVIDAVNPIGNGLILPAGDLREPVSSLGRADIILVNKTDLVAEAEADSLLKKTGRWSGDRPVFKASYRHDRLFRANDPDIIFSPGIIRGKRILAVCGIGNPSAFRTSLEKYEPAYLEMTVFPDHYYYTDDDIAGISYKSSGYDLLVITEKDFVKMRAFQLNDKFYVLKISLDINRRDLFKEKLLNFIEKAVK